MCLIYVIQINVFNLAGKPAAMESKTLQVDATPGKIMNKEGYESKIEDVDDVKVEEESEERRLNPRILRTVEGVDMENKKGEDKTGEAKAKQPGRRFSPRFGGAKKASVAEEGEASNEDKVLLFNLK